MLATLALSLLLNGPVEPRLAVRLSIDQDGGLSSTQLRQALDEVRKIWSDAGVAVSAGRFGEPCLPDEARISLRILLSPPPVRDGAERILAWVTPSGSGRSAPVLLVSLPAVSETVLGTVAFDRPVRKLTRALQDRLIAQAIGRVAAHELGHYLLQNAGHQDRGLMRARYIASELVGDWLEPFKVPNTDQLAVRQEIKALARLQASGEQ
jgi:hypothetical protein